MTAAGPENQHGPGVCKTLLVPPGTSSSLQDPSCSTWHLLEFARPFASHNNTSTL